MSNRSYKLPAKTQLDYTDLTTYSSFHKMNKIAGRLIDGETDVDLLPQFENHLSRLVEDTYGMSDMANCQIAINALNMCEEAFVMFPHNVTSYAKHVAYHVMKYLRDSWTYAA